MTDFWKAGGNLRNWLSLTLPKEEPECVACGGDILVFSPVGESYCRQHQGLALLGWSSPLLEAAFAAGCEIEDVLVNYGVTLNVGRGYDGWDSIHNAAQRYDDGGGVAVLYFGDFDPSGEDMVRSLGERLAFFGCEPEIIKCALTLSDITRYNLPPDFTKATDTRRAAFVARHGDVSVELDALPVAVLRERLIGEVEARMDLDALAEVREIKQGERARLVEALRGV